MKAGKLAIRPWLSCQYTENTLIDEPCSGHNFSNKAFEATLELVKESRPPFLQILLILPILCVLSFLKMIYGINGVTILKMTYVRFTVEMV